MIQLSTGCLAICRFLSANRCNMLSTTHHRVLIFTIILFATRLSSIVSLFLIVAFIIYFIMGFLFTQKYYCGMQFFGTNVRLATARSCFFVYLIGYISVDAREIWWRDIGHRRAVRNSGNNIVLDNF